MSTHPLDKEPKWAYYQPVIELKSSIVKVPKKGGHVSVRSVTGKASCREGLITYLRRDLILKTAKTIKSKKDLRWSRVPAQYELQHKLSLEHERNKEVGRTTFSISSQPITPNRSPPSIKFLHLTDAIIGPIALLINPDRPRGCCRSSVAKRNVFDIRDPCKKPRKMYVWEGVDNTVLYSPALVAIFAGLYRQCMLLYRAGYTSKILSEVDRNQVRRIIDRNDEIAAREMIRKLKPWIEVPVPKSGTYTNFPFPMGQIGRLDNLLQAIEKHGPHKVFSENFLNSWGLASQINNCYYGSGGGVWRAWGHKGRTTKVYRNMVELASGKARSRPAPRGD